MQCHRPSKVLYYNLSYRNIYMIHTKNGQKRLKMTTFHHHYCVESLHRICVTVVITDNSRSEVSLLEQDTIENVSQPIRSKKIILCNFLVRNIAIPLDSLLLRGVAPRPCFWQRARRHARPRDGLKTGSCTEGS